MKLGLLTPVVSMNPRAFGAWEVDAGIEQIAEIAEAADRLGYHHLTCSEHVALPANEETERRRGTRYWDPLAVFGYLAARTERIRFATYVLVLGYHHPLEIAKRYGTLDLVSGGRIVLGVGVGSLREEFELLGAPFDDRGPRADDAIRALRASFGTTTPSYDGPFYGYDGVVVDPTVRTGTPIWVGGRTRRSLRRAVELADGWVPFGLALDEIDTMLREVAPPDVRPDGFEVGVWPVRLLDPVAEQARVAELIADHAARGVTMLNVRLAHESVAHLLEQLEAMASLVVG
jgi:probable F420-dependent oxidoreductase